MLVRVCLALFAALWLIGCAQPQPKSVDSVKSCEALLYEAQATQALLDQTALAAEDARRREVPLHIFVMILGTAVSLQPTLLTGEYFYAAPAATIAYFNYYARTPEVLDRFEYLSDRQRVVAKLIEEKSCKTAPTPKL